MVFVDLEKAFDRIPRDLIWWCLRKKGVPEEYVKIVQDMYRSSKTQVVTQKGETEYFLLEVGLHQGSALSPLLFIIIIIIIIMAGMAVVLSGWLPHREAQMAYNYCFPTRTMF